MQATIVMSEYETERKKPMPSKNHANIQGNLYFMLRLKYYERYNFIPEVSILIHGTTNVPDIAIFKDASYEPGYDEISLTEIPAGVVEILSPTQSMSELITKSYRYFEAGVQSYWLVLPETKTIYVYSAPNEYEAYVKTGILKDTQLDIELDIAQAFAVRPKK